MSALLFLPVVASFSNTQIFIAAKRIARTFVGFNLRGRDAVPERDPIDFRPV